MGSDEISNQQSIHANKTIKNIENQQIRKIYLNDNKSGVPTPIRKSHSPELQYKTNNFNPDMQKQSIISNSTIKKSNLMYKDNQSFITNTTIKKRDFKCTKDKRELMNELNYFLNQVNIQNQFFEKRKNLNDPVFELIQKEEKKIVNEFFYKNKDSFINELLNYLNYQKTNFNPNIIQQIINSENGYQIYKNKIENVISKINIEKSTFQIDHLTVLLLGKSGVGKTTLINKILGVNAPTGEGSFITTQTTPYKSNSMPFLRLVDTRGIELSVNFGAAELQNEAMRFITEQIQTNNYNNFVHCIWYCITTKRFEKVEVDILNRIRSIYQGNKIPIIIVYTQSVDKKAITKMKQYILGQIQCNDFVEILAEDISLDLEIILLNHLESIN